MMRTFLPTSSAKRRDTLQIFRGRTLKPEKAGLTTGPWARAGKQPARESHITFYFIDLT
jgi:hypothetical protein